MTTFKRLEREPVHLRIGRICTHSAAAACTRRATITKLASGNWRAQDRRKGDPDAVVMLGFMMLYAVLTQAMNKGYDVKDTKYKAVTGEGESRQEHEMLFNLTQPGQ